MDTYQFRVIKDLLEKIAENTSRTTIPCQKAKKPLPPKAKPIPPQGRIITEGQDPRKRK